MKNIIVVLVLSAMVLPGVASAQSGRHTANVNSNQRVRSISRMQVRSGIVEPFALLHGTDAEGSAAPNFTLMDLQGHSVTLESLRGKVVLLNFWATWCPFCVEDLPAIEQLQRQFKNQGLVVLGINVEDAETARAFMQQHGYTFKTVVDTNNQVAQLYNIEVLPSVFVIGRDGQIVSRMFGAKDKGTLSDAIALAGIKTDSRAAE